MRINQLRAGFFDCMYHAMRVEYIYMEKNAHKNNNYTGRRSDTHNNRRKRHKV